MFARIGKVLFLVGLLMAILSAACGSGEQVNPNPTTNQAVAKAATTPSPGVSQAPTNTAAPKAATTNNPPGNGIAPKPTTTGEGDLFAFTPTSPPAASQAANHSIASAATSAGMGGIASTVALAAMAAPPPASDPVDPCRALPCSDDSDPWLGCRYAAALYRDAPGTTQGVRSVVGKMSSRQLEWYKSALLESYRHDLWYSADYRLGSPEDLEQTHKDVRAMVFGDKETYSMNEEAICDMLGSTDITLADIIAASRANSPFVAKKKATKETTGKVEILEDLPAAADEPAATTGCGADPCPPPAAAPVAPDPAATPPAEGSPATPAFDPAAVPPATDPVPAEPPADAPATPPAMDPAVPSEPGGAAPTPPSGEGTLTRNFRHEVRF